jgi:hypothetical protein
MLLGFYKKPKKGKRVLKSKPVCLLDLDVRPGLPFFTEPE